MRKGVVISIDALMAVFIVLSVISISAYYFGQVSYEEKSNLTLKETTMDLVTVLEKNGELNWAVENNRVNQLRVFMNKLPKSICTDLGIYEGSDLNNAQLSVVRPNCEKNFSESTTISRAFIVANNGTVDIYVARLTAWYKVN
ncbi:MAG: hypothetical protein COV47_01490 [Candidatus Diapherotrites archaeon CG11_big_fil_rev_8_21_14_0_20_37_9]|nr:MAG: hypothetical protein COV47_01490 [Candidatus Diapherotrites archaeon CG11_big_fil_rev_8_21_14_0_20_37_9]